MVKEESTCLSYSSASLLQNCEQRYTHYKVNKTPYDSDAAADFVHFNVGKAFHEALENTMHTDRGINGQIVIACKKYRVEEYFLMIRAMVWKYLNMHKLSGFKCVHCELELRGELMLGFIDMIMVNRNGWVIGDLKTSATWYPSVMSRLPMDYQLNLYSHFVPYICKVLKLDPDKFLGCSYRVTTKAKLIQAKGETIDGYNARILEKTKAKRKDGETVEEYNERIIGKSKLIRRVPESEQDYFNRVYNSINCYDVFIPKSAMRIEQTWQKHLMHHQRSMELRDGSVPKRNYSYCEAYFKPCPYWSQCHSNIFTECNQKVELNTEQSYKDKQQLILEVL